MGLHETRVQGIVAVMDDQQHQERTAALGSALARLSQARERRGPVGVVDPFEVVSAEERRAIAETPRANQRRGLFSFSERAKQAVRSDD